MSARKERALVSRARQYLQRHGRYWEFHGVPLGNRKLIEAQLLVRDLTEALAQRIKADENVKGTPR